MFLAAYDRSRIPIGGCESMASMVGMATARFKVRSLPRLERETDERRDSGEEESS